MLYIFLRSLKPLLGDDGQEASRCGCLGERNERTGEPSHQQIGLWQFDIERRCYKCQINNDINSALLLYFSKVVSYAISYAIHNNDVKEGVREELVSSGEGETEAGPRQIAQLKPHAGW